MTCEVWHAACETWHVTQSGMDTSGGARSLWYVSLDLWASELGSLDLLGWLGLWALAPRGWWASGPWTCVWALGLGLWDPEDRSSKYLPPSLTALREERPNNHHPHHHHYNHQHLGWRPCEKLASYIIWEFVFYSVLKERFFFWLVWCCVTELMWCCLVYAWNGLASYNNFLFYFVCHNRSVVLLDLTCCT